MTINGTPEGRQGIWLLAPEDAVAFVGSLRNEKIHNFIGSGLPMMIGCDWGKDSIFELIRRDGMRIALMFPPNHTMSHQLVVLNDTKRWMFDVGVIKESVMRDLSKEGRSPSIR